MGIYDKNGGGLNLSLPEIPFPKVGLIILVVVVVLALAFFSAQTLLAQKALSARFSPEEWSLAGSNSNLLVVDITNTQSKLVSDSTIRVRPADFDSLNVFPASQNVQNIESGNNREYQFVVRTNKPADRFVPGKYSFVIEWVIDGKVVDSQNISLNITR